MYVVFLREVHPDMKEGERVNFVPFNPLGSVRRTGQNREQGSALGEYFVSLRNLLQDCDQMEDWWAETVRAFPQGSNDEDAMLLL